MNVALMLKWVWKLFQDGNQLWRQIINAKYVFAGDILHPRAKGDLLAYLTQSEAFLQVWG
jgi:hypothetical protein